MTKYYEYGRYDPAAFGVVRNKGIPDVKLSGGKPTAKSLANTLTSVSTESGQSGSIEAVYIELEARIDRLAAALHARRRPD